MQTADSQVHVRTTGGAAAGSCLPHRIATLESIFRQTDFPVHMLIVLDVLTQRPQQPLRMFRSHYDARMHPRSLHTRHYPQEIQHELRLGMRHHSEIGISPFRNLRFYLKIKRFSFFCHFLKNLKTICNILKFSITHRNIRLKILILSAGNRQQRDSGIFLDLM